MLPPGLSKIEAPGAHPPQEYIRLVVPPGLEGLHLGARLGAHLGARLHV